MSLFRKHLRKGTQEQAVEKILQTDFGENSKVKLKLNGNKLVFDDGQWKTEELENVDVLSVLKKNKELEEENNFLKLKIEVLLLMLAENTVKINNR